MIAFAEPLAAALAVIASWAVPAGATSPGTDPFAWLESGEAPEVERWTVAQNAATRQALDAFPGRAALEQRLWGLFEIGSLGTPISRPIAGPAGPTRRYFYTRRDGKQNQPVLYVSDGLGGAERALVDVNRDRPDGTRALDWWVPSDDGARLAYGVSDDGSEESTLRVREVATGRDRDDTIVRTRSCSLAWTPDGAGFYYTRYPRPGEVPAAEMPYHRSVFHHRLGDDPDKDRKLFGDGRDRTDWPGVDLSPDGRWLAITVSQGWSKSEIYLHDTRGAGPLVPVATGEEAQFQVVDLLDDRLYLQTTSGAPRGRLFVVDPAHPERTRWREIIPQSQGEKGDVLKHAAYVKGTLAVVYLSDAAARLRLFDRDGAARGEVALPSLGSVTGLSGARDAEELFYSFNSFVTPTSVFRLAAGAVAAAGPITGTLWRRLLAPVDPGHYEVERVTATSRDGTRVPIFLVHRKGLARDGRHPAVLTGYGGFDVSMLPSWTASAIPFLDAGGTYALAVLRGGGEYGEAWHQAGMLGRKQNVFDDFIAASEWLIASKVTSAARLAISGRSNGGLLVGAALTQRPDLYRAVVCGVPLLDMLRYHRFRLAALWIPEYGSPDDPAARRWLAAYSPYQAVRDGVRYPAVLIHTAASDTRVDPMHARKMVARLQAAGAHVAAPRPVLLRMESHAGHGAGKPLGKVISQLTDEWSFLFSQLGMTITDAKAK
jgi:prolyl oligopeptidase